MSATLQNLNFIVSLTDHTTKPLGGIMSKLDGLHNRFTKGALNIGVGTAGLYAVGAAFDTLTHKSIEFETSLADINRVKNFANPEAMKKFGTELLNLTHTIPMTGVELAKIAEQGAALPLDDKGLIDFTKQVAFNTVAWGMAADETGSHMVALSKKLDIPIEKIGKYSDTINYLTNKTGTAPAQTLDTINRMGSSMKALKFSPEQIAALGNTFTELKVAPDQAGTAITNMMLKLGAARTESKGVRGAFADLGLSVGQLEANLVSAGGQATFNDILTRLAKLDEVSQRNVASELFGKEHAGKLSALLQKLDVYRKNLALAGDAQAQLNSSQIEFQTRANTTAGRITQLNNLLDHARITAGDTFTGILSEAFPQLHVWLTTLVTDIGKFTEQHPLLTKLIGYTVVGLGALAGVLALVAIGWGLVTIMALPAVLPILAIVAAVGLLAWAIKAGSSAFTEFLNKSGTIEWLAAKWGKLKTWWFDFKTWLFEFDLYSFLLGKAVTFASNIISLWRKIPQWWGQFKGWLSSLDPFGVLLGGINNVINKVAGIGTALRSALSAGGGIGVPAVVGGGAPRNIIGKLQGGGNSSTKSVTVNVKNNGGSVSPAAIGHHLRMAGG